MAFPETRESAVAWLCSADEALRARGVRVIAEVYWSAIYTHLRLKFQLSPEAAEDTVQAFLLQLVETDLLADYVPVRTRFRTYLRHCLDNFAIDAHRRASARRRRGTDLDLDFASVEAALAADRSDAAADLDRAWVLRIAEVAVERMLATLERNGKPVHAELFRRFHLQDDPPRYQAVADELGITATDVTNWLHAVRREFRTVALSLLREITASEEEFVDEARDVFGISLRTGHRTT